MQELQLALSSEIESAVASVRAALKSLDGELTNDEPPIWDELGRLSELAGELRELARGDAAVE